MDPRDFDDQRRKAPKFSGLYNNGKEGQYREGTGNVPNGRWPANVILDEVAAAALDEAGGERKTGTPARGGTERRNVHFDVGWGHSAVGQALDRSGGASRFFYTAKASRRERGEGNTHPTVKPLALMRWLVRLVTPPDGVVLDMFAGSGTTLVAAVEEGFEAIGIEQDAEYCAIIEKRLAGVQPRLALDEAPG